MRKACVVIFPHLLLPIANSFKNITFGKCWANGKKLSFACFIQFMPTHATLRVDVGLRDFLCVKKLIFLKLLSKIELMIAN